MNLLRCAFFAIQIGWRGGPRLVLLEFLQRWAGGRWGPVTGRLWDWLVDQ